jgi:multiple sugar transport system permease protein
MDNYQRIFSVGKYMTYFMNSIIVSFGTVFICLVAAILSGYSFSRFKIPFKNFAMTSILSVQMFPVVTILIPLYTLYLKFGLINTYLGLMLADASFSLPLCIWLLKSFFETIPKELDESACIDGCGRLKTLRVIILPLLKPGLVAVGVYTFLLAWDDFLCSLIIMNQEKMKTLPIGISQSFMGELGYDYAGMMTLSVIASLPIILIFIFLQKYMISGLTSGAVKG